MYKFYLINNTLIVKNARILVKLDCLILSDTQLFY